MRSVAMGQPWNSLVTAEGVTGKNLRKILYRRLTQGQDIVENALLAHVTRSPNQIDSKAMIVYPERTKGELTEPISNLGPALPCPVSTTGTDVGTTNLVPTSE